MKKWLPWWAKIVVKIVLSRLPVAYQAFARTGIFRHGYMDSPTYALSVIQKHLQQTDPTQTERGFVALELGPGDSVGSALIANALGASRCYLVDAGEFAIQDMQVYRAFADELRELAVPCIDIDDCDTLDALLHACGGVYLTSGLASLQQIPDNSVDFIWSQAVLEHIRTAEFIATMKELKRIMRTDGVASHRVDLKDHLGGSLNNMRIAGKHWEKEWMARSGFYTNRLRYSEMLSAFQQAGFQVEVAGTDRWAEPPLLTPQAAPANSKVYLMTI